MEKELKISIASGAWKRHRLFKYFCEYYQQLKEVYPFRLIVSCTEKETFDMCMKYGHQPVMVDNTPLYRKMNASVKKADGSDYTILIGSDDFISEKAFLYYIELFKQKIDYIYTLDWYFYDTISKRSLYWGGYDRKFNKGLGCGAGRAVSRNLMEQLQWEPWPPGYDKVLDTGMERKLDKLKFTHYGFKLKDFDLFCLDIKTEVNMTPFNVWPNCTLMEPKLMLQKYMPKETEKILAL